MERTLYSNEKEIISSRALKSFLTVIIISLVPLNLYAQKIQPGASDSTKVLGTVNPITAVKTTYPKVVGYLSFIVPIVTFNKDATTYNFNGTTSIGFPVGINVLYSDKFGFSYEFTPTIKSGNGTSKMSNLLFDPGTMFRFEHGFTIITRLAFETSGRYGFTPVFNKVYARSKYVNYFVALSTPTRFGNNDVPSLGLNVQFGFTFN
ncbi:MAG: hypothetical protein JWR54_20 [Mucilaginibacter sp.]|nr:hypothetical protein [Mucilaginibacter sp.]